MSAYQGIIEQTWFYHRLSRPKFGNLHRQRTNKTTNQWGNTGRPNGSNIFASSISLQFSHLNAKIIECHNHTVIDLIWAISFWFCICLTQLSHPTSPRFTEIQCVQRTIHLITSFTDTFSFTLPYAFYHAWLTRLTSLRRAYCLLSYPIYSLFHLRPK